MNLITWNPWNRMSLFRGHMGRMLDDFFPVSADDEASSIWNWHPVVDMFEKDNEIVIKAELPGLRKEDIAIDLKGRTLTLKGERSVEKDVGKGGYYRKERAYGHFHRSFILPAEIDADQVDAVYKDGILEIVVAKPELQVPKQITVQ